MSQTPQKSAIYDIKPKSGSGKRFTLNYDRGSPSKPSPLLVISYTKWSRKNSFLWNFRRFLHQKGIFQPAFVELSLRDLQSNSFGKNQLAGDRPLQSDETRQSGRVSPITHGGANHGSQPINLAESPPSPFWGATLVNQGVSSINPDQPQSSLKSV